jgi:hypothetical protein
MKIEIDIQESEAIAKVNGQTLTILLDYMFIKETPQMAYKRNLATIFDWLKNVKV